MPAIFDSENFVVCKIFTIFARFSMHDKHDARNAGVTTGESISDQLQYLLTY